MESRVKTGAVMAASTRSGRDVGLRRNGVQLLSYRGLLMVALVFVTSTTFVIKDAHCSTTSDAVAPAPTLSKEPTQPILTFNQYEADALNAVFQQWKKQNPQLSTRFKWSLERHPCDNLTGVIEESTGNIERPLEFDLQGAWIGVGCTAELQNLTGIPKHYHVFVSSLTILGSNSGCSEYYHYEHDQCGFDGIIGQLPPEISNLTNLQYLKISSNPKLTGPVPVEILQMPNVSVMILNNNSLSGSLPSDAAYNPDCKLNSLILSNNNFSGSLRVSSQGIFFCSSLLKLDVGFNQLHGPINLQDWNISRASPFNSLSFRNNRFGGTFSIDRDFPAMTTLDLSCNHFTDIQFTKYIGSTPLNSLESGPSSLDLNISNNNFSGPFLKENFQYPTFYSLDLSMNHFWGSIDLGSFNETRKLDYLNISNNNFNGTFSTNAYIIPLIMDLSHNQFKDIKFHVYNETTPSNGTVFLNSSVKKIYFQNNNLSGQFPATILTTTSLQILDASENQYETLQLPIHQLENSSLLQVFITKNKLDVVQYPKNGRFSTSNLQFSSLLFLGGNPICKKIKNTIFSSVCRLNRTDEPRLVIPKSTKMKVIIPTSTSSLALMLLLVVTGVYVWRLMGKIKALHIILEEFDKKEVKPNLYSYKEVKLATNNFDKYNKLGEGGFGVVYKGELFDGTQAAVKKLTMSSNQVLSEFLNEVIVISGLKHCNLVKLKGCCLGDGDQRILVFEYVENNNLAEALWMHGDLQSNIEPPCLDWKRRFNIIVGIAKGLAYLHEELQPPVIHRDIKASNILLDKNYNAKIADFGLAYLFPTLDNEASHLTFTQVAGTRGYCSPEYALHGHVSTALDVYSFGILVLEVVSRRKNIDLQKPSEEIYLRDWASKQYEAKALMALIDPKMDHSPMDLEAILRVLVVAIACVDYKAAKRPKMYDVVSTLLGKMSINQFQRGFEDGDEIDETSVEFPIILSTTSSL